MIRGIAAVSDVTGRRSLPVSLHPDRPYFAQLPQFAGCGMVNSHGIHRSVENWAIAALLFPGIIDGVRRATPSQAARDKS